MWSQSSQETILAKILQPLIGLLANMAAVEVEVQMRNIDSAVQ